ncbi:MAG: Fic family protein [Gammaproteobacteria bacterium]|jgi:Fic family protein|nr:Fic family protein [Gammaproteobacteria bacterium]
MHSLSSDYLTDLRLSASQAVSLRAVGEFQGKQALYYQQAPETLKTLRESAVIESTESSSRIEGVIVAPARLGALMKRTTDPHNRSEQEIAGYRDALALIHESAHAMSFTTNVVLQLHSTLYRYLAEPGGRWKASQNEITETVPDGGRRVRFIPTPPHLTPVQMQSLTERYAEAAADKRMDGLILVPLVVLDFLCIHPFSDGNGRIARLLMLMLLYQHGYEVGRYISLERIIEGSKESYYETLEVSSRGWHDGRHDVIPWLEYFWGVLIRAYREFEQRVKVVHEGRGAKSEQVRVAVLKRSEPFAISEIERECSNVSRDMVRYVLRQMRDAGLIESTGVGRGAKWQLVDRNN